MTTKEKTHAYIRWMIRRDMDEILQIEQQSFDQAWTEQEFLTVLRQKDQIGMVATIGEKVVGYMIYKLDKGKLTIITFAVHPFHRRQGLGSQMVAKLVEKITMTSHRTRLVLMVRESNLFAQLFFRSQRFRAIKVLPRYYQDNGEDGYKMVWHK